MATYDITVGGPVGLDHQMKERTYWVPIDVKTTDVIASDATLTTNEKITAADVISIFDIPAGVVLTGRAVLETLVAGTAGNTADIGLAAAGNLFSAVSLAATAGTLQVNLIGDAWGATTVNGVTFAATDTLDMEFIADEITGRWIVWVEIVDLSKAGLVPGY